jgi:hypothetical protein
MSFNVKRKVIQLMRRFTSLCCLYCNKFRSGNYFAALFFSKEGNDFLAQTVLERVRLKNSYDIDTLRGGRIQIFCRIFKSVAQNSRAVRELLYENRLNHIWLSRSQFSFTYSSLSFDLVSEENSPFCFAKSCLIFLFFLISSRTSFR